MHHKLRITIHRCLRRRPEDEGIVASNTFSSWTNFVVVTDEEYDYDDDLEYNVYDDEEDKHGIWR